MTTSCTDYAPLQHWMRYGDDRVNNLLHIADYADTFVTDEDLAAMRAEVRRLTYIPLEPELSDGAVKVLIEDLRAPIDQAQRIEDGDLDAGAGWHDLNHAVELLRDVAAEVALAVMNVKGHRVYCRIKGRTAA